MIESITAKHHQHFALFGITSLTFVSFYVSSLLFASLQDDSRLGLRRSFYSLLNPSSLKSAVKADFLTLEPKAWNESVTLASTNAGGAGAAIDEWRSAASNLQLAQLKNKKTGEYNAVNAATIALGVGMSRSKSDTSGSTYNNSSLIADSGTIKINTLNDATIKGANLLAQDVILNTGGDLTVASLQDSFQQKGSSFGLSLGGGAGVSGGGSANFGINYGSSKTDRVWTVSAADFYNNLELLERIKELKSLHPFFGYRRIWAVLKFRDGLNLNKKKVYRLMKIVDLLIKPNLLLRAN